MSQSYDSMDLDLLLAIRSKFQLEQSHLSHEMLDLNTRVRTSGRLPDKEYRGICKRQSVIRARKIELSASIDEIALLIRRWREMEKITQPEVSLSGRVAKWKIERLRSKYLEFAEDQTRISSMRTMAAQIAKDLVDLLDEGEQ